jgi:succinyl-diaminopimelate desuccinylase
LTNRNIEIDRVELRDLLAELISIKSVNPAFDSDSAGEEESGLFLVEYLKKNKIPVERQEVLPGRFNVVGKLKGARQDHFVLFNAHLDTVSVEGMEIDPFKPEIRDKRMYGRGACDVKGGLAAMLLALKAVSKMEAPPPHSIWLLASIDEEHSFRGIKHFASQAPPALAAVVAEPTLLDIVVSHKGILRWAIRTRGRQAHSSKPQLGVNAISKMAHLIKVLEERLPPLYDEQRHPLLGPATFNVGMISGGIQANLVPDRCEIQIDRRTLPGETAEQILADFEIILKDLAADESDFQAEIDAPVLEDPALETSPESAIARSARRACQEVSGHYEFAGVPYATDASKLADIGIPCIVLGPGSIDRAHSSVEFVELDQVEKAAQIYARIMMDPALSEGDLG